MNTCSLLLFALGALLAAVPAHAQAGLQADLVVHNARIYTANPAQPQAEALAVRSGRVALVGTNAEVLAAYPAAPRLDAQGRTLLPGLIDAHVHLMGQGLSMLQADLVGARSKQEVVERLEAFAATLPPGAWVTGRGWDQNDWPEKAFPTAADLDAAFPDRPVWLRRIDGHAAWGNTAALRAAGVTAASADPEGGKILRDAEGRPTGVFIDAAMNLVDGRVPAPAPEQYAQALQLAIAEANRYGLTSVHEAGVGLDQVRLYQQAIDDGRFSLRVYAMIGGRGEAFDYFCENGPLIDYGDRLTVRSVKFYIDGALGSRGAALLEEYSDDPGNHGLLMEPPERFAASVKRAMECGFQVNTHAIGDRGNRVVLDAYAEAIAATGGEPGRHRIEHAQVVALDDIPRFAELGLVASMQPTHATSDMYWAEDRVGPVRIRGAYAWRRFAEAGVPLAFGSDFPVEQVNPLLGFYAAVTRQDAERWPEGGWYADQVLTRTEALHAFTRDAAYAAFQENELGSLEPGKWADFVILSADVMTIPAPEILQTRVVATYLAGRPVYEAR